MKHIRDLFTTLLFLMLLTVGTSSGAAAPEGQITWALHFSPTPTWLDPAEISGTPAAYNTLYALHDAMIRPSPGHPMVPSLAESWSASPDGLVYEFVLRKGVKWGQIVNRQTGQLFTLDDPCMERGATVAYNAPAHTAAIKDVKEFLTSAFKLNP